jgi:hypothetical protein
MGDPTPFSFDGGAPEFGPKSLTFPVKNQHRRFAAAAE